MKSWFDLARRVLHLTVQLDARTTELRSAHKQVAYWRQLAGERWDNITRLNAEVDKANFEERGMSDPIPSVVSVPLGSRDRANALRLAAENAELRALVDDLKNGRNPS